MAGIDSIPYLVGSNDGEGRVSLALNHKDSPFLGEKPTYSFSPLCVGISL